MGRNAHIVIRYHITINAHETMVRINVMPRFESGRVPWDVVAPLH